MFIINDLTWRENYVTTPKFTRTNFIPTNKIYFAILIINQYNYFYNYFKKFGANNKLII